MGMIFVCMYIYIYLLIYFVCIQYVYMYMYNFIVCADVDTDKCIQNRIKEYPMAPWGIISAYSPSRLTRIRSGKAFH